MDSDGERVRLYSRPGNDFTRRFPLIVEALVRLRARSCIVDREVVACGDDGGLRAQRGDMLAAIIFSRLLRIIGL